MLRFSAPDSLLKNDYFARGNKVQVKTKSKVESDEEEEESVTDTPKKKKKYRLLMHEVHKFVDSSEEVFVWSYEPPSSQTYLLGVLVGEFLLWYSTYLCFLYFLYYLLCMCIRTYVLGSSWCTYVLGSSWHSYVCTW